MSKLLTRWLSAALVCSALAACGGGSDAPTAQAPEAPTVDTSIANSVDQVIAYLQALVNDDTSEPLQLGTVTPASDDTAEPSTL